MADFGIHFSVQLITDYETAMAARPKDASGKPVFIGPAYDQWLAGYRQVRGRMSDAALAFMLDLASDSSLQPIEHADRRGHRGANAWNRFVAGGWKGDSYFSLLADRLLNAAMAARYAAAAATPEAKHASVVSAMNKGDFQWFESDSREQCRITGEELHLEFINWRPVLGSAKTTPGGSWKDTKFEPLAAPAPQAKVEHHVLQAPSGQLLISDWFRFPALTELVDAGTEIDHHNDAAELRTVAHYAAEHNLMSVFVGNSSPDILKRDSLLVIGCSDPDLPEPKDHCGHVSTRLWRATAVDRQLLVGLLARSMSHFDAEKAVHDYIQNNDVVQVNVRAGTLHLYHTANHSHMRDFRSPGVPHVEGLDIFAVLSERELQWHHKDAPAATRKPRARP